MAGTHTDYKWHNHQSDDYVLPQSKKEDNPTVHNEIISSL